MAYKFQLGPAVLSGSIKAEDGIVGTDVDDATAANIVAQIDAGEIPIAKLAANTISGKALGQSLDALSVDDSSIEFSAGSDFDGSAASAIRVKAAGITNAMLAGSIENAKLSNSTISGKALGANLDQLSVADNKGLSMSAYNGSAAVSDLQVVLDPAGGLEFNGSSGIRLEAAVAGAGMTHTNGVLAVVGAAQGGIDVQADDIKLDFGALGAASVDLANDSFAFWDADATAVKKVAISSYLAAIAGNGLHMEGDQLDVKVDDSSVELNADTVRVKALGITNAMLAGSIENAKLSNSTISGKALGTNLDSLSVAPNKGLSMSSYNGSGAVSDLQVVLEGAGGLEFSGTGTVQVKAAGITNAMLSGSIADSKLLKISSDNKLDINAIDIANGPNMTAALADLDEFIIDDAGTRKKMASSVLATYAKSKFSAATAAGKAEGSLAYDASTGAYTFTQMSVAELRAHLSVADSNSMDFSYSSGQVSADLRLGSADALEIDGDGLDLKATIGGNRTFSGDVVISGDLTVNGTNTVLNTTTLEVEDKNIYLAKGNTDSSGADGAGFTIEMGSDDLTFAWAHADSRMELKKGAAYASLKANKFIGDLEGAVAQSIQSIADADGTLQVGFNYGSADTTAARTWTLPASPEVGQVVHVKAPSSVHADGIKIQKAGSQNIDGEDFIILESDFAAVNLMYVASNTWRVY